MYLALIPTIDVINWRNAQCIFLKLNGFEPERLLYVFFLSNYTGLLIHEHYTRECKYENFDKIKKQKQHKKQNNTKKQKNNNTKTFG